MLALLRTRNSSQFPVISSIDLRFPYSSRSRLTLYRHVRDANPARTQGLTNWRILPFEEPLLGYQRIVAPASYTTRFLSPPRNGIHEKVAHVRTCEAHLAGRPVLARHRNETDYTGEKPYRTLQELSIRQIALQTGKVSERKEKERKKRWEGAIPKVCSVARAEARSNTNVNANDDDDYDGTP